MSIADIIFIVAGLSVDNMAAAVAFAGHARTHKSVIIFRTSAAFVFAGVLAFTAGWGGGIKIYGYINRWDHWIAFLVLGYIGVKMFKESREKEDDCGKHDISSLRTLVMLAVATNIDVFAVGISLSMYEINFWLILGLLALFISGATAAGFIFGAKTGRKFGKKAAFASGLALIVLGLKILLEGLLF